MTERQDSSQNILTVSALTKYVKKKFEVDPHLREVAVVGEVTNYRHRPRGHQYFSLKDDKARINAVMFMNLFNRLPFQLEEGMKVIVTGQVSVYEPSGQYQINIRRIEPEGVGALYQALAQLKERFKKEGLFDRPKSPIPRYPKKIAVVTSPTGAVIRDILTTLQRRYPIVDVTVFPTRVQGEGAAQEIADAFHKINAHAQEFDTVIVARGGGSIEDLWSFNEEVVARAILACPLPVISSVGHEVDTTIADLVADLRAPTPTAAAELAVPVLVDLLSGITQVKDRLRIAISRQLNSYNHHHYQLSESFVFVQPERLYQTYSQQLDLLSRRLMGHFEQQISQRSLQVHHLNDRLVYQTPERRIAEEKINLQQLAGRLKVGAHQRTEQSRSDFERQVGLLDAYSPLKVLQRGYAIVNQEAGIVRSVQQVKTSDPLRIQFKDGAVDAQVVGIDEHATLLDSNKGDNS